jgi:hypothetical protein
LRIYAVEDKLPSKEQWLIIRVDDSDGATKYQLSNAPLDTTIDRFAQMSCSVFADSILTPLYKEKPIRF